MRPPYEQSAARQGWRCGARLAQGHLAVLEDLPLWHPFSLAGEAAVELGVAVLRVELVVQGGEEEQLDSYQQQAHAE